MTTISKKYLQSLHADHQVHTFIDLVTKNVLQEARRGRTSYVFRQLQSEKSSEFQILFELVQTKFPDCKVEIKQAVSLNGTVERGIVIDWSENESLS